jgi:hypothetical protein
MTPAEPWQWVFTIGCFALVYLCIGLGQGWLIRAIQITIVMAAVGSNIQWPWTQSPILPGLLGIGIAWLLTVAPVLLWDRLHRKPRARLSRDIVKRKQSTELDL